MWKKLVFLSLLFFVFLFVTPSYAYELMGGPTQLIQYDASKAYEGYTLFSSGGTPKTYLIDMLGNVVHEWNHENYSTGEHFVLLENGHILGNTRSGRASGPPTGARGGAAGGPGGGDGAGARGGAARGPGGGDGAGGGSGWMTLGGSVSGLIELDWDGNVVWRYEPGEEDGTLHHDFKRLSNGNTFANAWETIPYEEAVAAGRRTDQTTERGVATDVIYEIDPEGNVIWKWSAWDHRGTNSKFNLDVNYITYVIPEYSRDNPDWTHFNNVDYDPDTDRILTDSREFGELYIIDHKTGDILYRWGNPSAYGAGEGPTISTEGDQILFGPHDAHWIEDGLPGAGNILIYNNGWGRSPTSYSSVIEMNPETDEIVWEYGQTFSSHHISGSQRLPNGNTLVCSGWDGHLFEVTPDKEIVWEYVNPISRAGASNWTSGGNNVFRAHRYSPDYPGLKGKDLTPKGQIVEDIKDGWKPRVNTTGATQPGVKIWEKIWE